MNYRGVAAVRGSSARLELRLEIGGLATALAGQH